MDLKKGPAGFLSLINIKPLFDSKALDTRCGQFEKAEYVADPKPPAREGRKGCNSSSVPWRGKERPEPKVVSGPHPRQAESQERLASEERIMSMQKAFSHAVGFPHHSGRGTKTLGFSV